MDDSEITLTKIRHRSNLDGSLFLILYEKLVMGDINLSDPEKSYLLRVAIYFLNSKDERVERLGYRIVLRYSNVFKDYLPLYEVALSRDYIPITKFIERKHFDPTETKETFSSLFISAYQEGFKIDGDPENVYRSLGQMMLSEFVANEDNVAVIAPTSYGKSEMIIKKVESNTDKKICVIVPSKALLAQTKKSLFRNTLIKNNFQKIITHPDMFREGSNHFLAVLTQERLLRLLQKNKNLSIDLVLVDEAHNLLEDNDRSHLLAQVLLILQKRKSDFTVNFFTPFLVDIGNLNIRNHIGRPIGRPMTEYMKAERFYAYDIALHEFYLYDQFLNRVFPIENEASSTDIDFIFSQKSSKNIVYLNRPMTVEQVSLEITRKQGEIEITPEIEKIIDSISKFIHPDYNLIKCIRSGVLYHHGGIPDIVRLYVEDIFSKHDSFEFIITTSTLLEGVNIPAEKIFILNPSKGHGHLSASQFKNLIGRVCRFREVFNDQSGSLEKLEPQIYLVKGKYAPKNFSMLSFYRTKVNSSVIIEDEVKNPLLENSEITDARLNNALEYLENMEPGASGLENVTQAQSQIARLCYENNVHDFNIINNEATLVTNLEYYIQIGHGLVNSPESLINAIVSIFFEGINLADKADNIIRLKENAEARSFYSMFIGWRSKGSPFPLMINRFLSYWNRRENEGETFIYIGSKWGEEVRRGGHQKLYVKIREKSEVQRINLAIAKIKEEQEFIDFNILKYLEILREINLVDIDFYDQVKYGTSDKEIICMLKNGFSMELSKLLKTTYHEYLEFDLNQDLIGYNNQLVGAMKQNNENDILIFEVESNI